MNGLVFLAKQVAGGWIGVGVVTAATQVYAVSATPPDARWQWLFVPALCGGLCLAFQTARRDFPWTFLSCAIAYVGMLAGTAVFGANLGNLLGTVVAVIYSNVWASRTGRPTSIVLVPAIILLAIDQKGPVARGCETDGTCHGHAQAPTASKVDQSVL